VAKRTDTYVFVNDELHLAVCWNKSRVVTGNYRVRRHSKSTVEHDCLGTEAVNLFNLDTMVVSRNVTPLVRNLIFGSYTPPVPTT
jgi:hypothetical protein